MLHWSNICKSGSNTKEFYYHLLEALVLMQRYVIKKNKNEENLKYMLKKIKKREKNVDVS